MNSVKTEIDSPQSSWSMSGSIECGCEGVEQGLATCLAEIKQVKEGLILVATVTGLPTAILLGVTIACG